MFFKTATSNPPYTLKRFKRSKSLRITVHPSGEIIVTAPTRVSKRYINNFVSERKDWIREKIEYFLSLPEPHISTKKEDYPIYKEKTRILVKKLIEDVNEHYEFKFNRIAIRDQKTRWGSCSRDGNLNFNYKLFFLPERLARYVVIHELCHLKEFNHGPRFWNLVAQTMPDYKNVVKELRDFKI